MKKILLFLILIFLVSSVSADCIITLDQDLYSQEAVATATMICSAPQEQNQTYTLNWTNSSGHQVHLDTGTTPAVKNTYFYDTYTIDSNYVATYGSQLNITLTGTQLEGEDNSTVATAGTTDLVITGITLVPDFFIGSYGAVQFSVKDSSGGKISNAQCVIDIVNGHNLPIVASGREVPSQGDGTVLYSFFLTEGIFYEDEDYKIDIACTCFNTSGFTSGGIGYCFESTGDQINAFKHVKAQYPFSITDIADKIVINQTVDITLGTGIWVENEHSYRANMTVSLPTLFQNNINWNNYADEDGKAFLTAGEKFRVCMYVNNTFDGLKHILITDLNLLRKTGYMVHSLCIDGSQCDADKIVMHTSIQAGNYQKCSDWMGVPSYIKGQNNYKVNFHMQVEGYEQEYIAYSDRFTIFGEEEDKDYLDYLTINNVSFTKLNVSEGEYTQLKINITNNHLTKNIEARLHIEFDSNDGGNERKIKPIPYNLNNWVAQDSVFHYDRLFDANEEDVILTPRFKVPYGLKDLDLFDVISADFALHILDDKHGGILYTQFWTGAEPTIDVSYYDINFKNITVPIYNTEVSACSSTMINISYDNIVSDTNAVSEEDQRYIVRMCVENTVNDIYRLCKDVKIQPDNGRSQNLLYKFTIPYIQSSSPMESEFDAFVYTCANEECTIAKELISTISGDEGQATFNITHNSADSCKYSSVGIGTEDYTLYNEYLERAALEGIENKTGTFHLDVNCPSTGTIGGDISCIITAYIEDSQTVQKEVDFTCYISDGTSQHSSMNFNQMITRNALSMSRSFAIPTSFTNGQQYILQCNADYYNLGSRRDSFYDTFTVRGVASGGGGLGDRGLEDGDADDTGGAPITGGAVDEERDKETPKIFGSKNLFIYFILLIVIVSLIILLVRHRKLKDHYYGFKMNNKKIFKYLLITLFVLMIFGMIIGGFYGLKFIYNNIFIRSTESTIINNQVSYPLQYSSTLQDPLFRGIILTGFIVLMTIILFKALDLRGEIKFGRSSFDREIYKDKKATRLQKKLNKLMLKEEIKREMKKEKYKVRKMTPEEFSKLVKRR